MHIEIHHRHAGQIVMIKRMFGGNGHVAKQAETHPMSRHGVVAGWPNQPKGIIHLAIDHCQGRQYTLDDLPGGRHGVPLAERIAPADVERVHVEGAGETVHLLQPLGGPTLSAKISDTVFIDPDGSRING